MAKAIKGWFWRLVDDLAADLRFDVGHGEGCDCDRCHAERQDFLVW